MMGRIDWIPIADLPEAFKDTRRLLLIDASEALAEAVVGWWDGEYGQEWRDHGDIGCNGQYDFEPTHFAEINPPD